MQATYQPATYATLHDIDQQCRAVLLRRKHEKNLVQRHPSGRQETGARKSRKSQPYNCQEPRADDHHIGQLRQLVRPIDRDSWRWGEFIYVDLAFVYMAFLARDYQRVHESITRMLPSAHSCRLLHLPEVDAEIEDLWYISSYYMDHEMRGRETVLDGPIGLRLKSVDRYRIRMRKPCPTVSLRGEKKYNLTKQALEILMQEFRLCPNPKREVKERIAQTTGNSFKTISNWFKNRRQRSKKATRTLVKMETLRPEELVSMTASQPQQQQQQLLLPPPMQQPQEHVHPPLVQTCNHNYSASYYENPNDRIAWYDPDIPSFMNYDLFFDEGLAQGLPCC